jgi:hypothetical protein
MSWQGIDLMLPTALCVIGVGLWGYVETWPTIYPWASGNTAFVARYGHVDLMAMDGAWLSLRSITSPLLSLYSQTFLIEHQYLGAYAHLLMCIATALLMILSHLRIATAALPDGPGLVERRPFLLSALIALAVFAVQYPPAWDGFVVNYWPPRLNAVVPYDIAAALMAFAFLRLRELRRVDYWFVATAWGALLIHPPLAVLLLSYFTGACLIASRRLAGPALRSALVAGVLAAPIILLLGGDATGLSGEFLWNSYVLKRHAHHFMVSLSPHLHQTFRLMSLVSAAGAILLWCLVSFRSACTFAAQVLVVLVAVLLQYWGAERQHVAAIIMLGPVRLTVVYVWMLLAWTIVTLTWLVDRGSIAAGVERTASGPALPWVRPLLAVGVCASFAVSSAYLYERQSHDWSVMARQYAFLKGRDRRDIAVFDKNASATPARELYGIGVYFDFDYYAFSGQGMVEWDRRYRELCPSGPIAFSCFDGLSFDDIVSVARAGSVDLWVTGRKSAVIPASYLITANEVLWAYDLSPLIRK